MRAKRLKLPTDKLRLMAETNVEAIVAAATEFKPKVLVVDSIQVVHSDELASAPGGVSQVRECAAYLTRFAKQTGTVLFLVGHVTKYEWYTKGILQAVDRYSLNGDLVGGSMSLENSILKPLTPGAPRILLDVFIQTAFNANGDQVVDKFTYALNCLGKKK